jgi:transcriptional regulator with XRE-family HTH domain
MRTKKSRLRSIFIYNLQIYRKKKNISQEKLALLSGIHRTGYHLIENGKSSPSLDTVEKIADALNVTGADLLKDPGIPLTDEPIFRMIDQKKIKNEKKVKKEASS